jgi:CRISPR-associated protein Csd2
MSLNNRYDFVILFDVENGNPNGDPDAGNMPRIDHETGYGIVTDVCIKRKIRNYVDILKDDESRFGIYIKESKPIIENRMKAYESCDMKITTGKKTEMPDKEKNYEKIVGFMCDNFYDVRAFGGVMSLEYNCGQVRGPIQLNFAKSVSPISPQEVTITKCVTDKASDKTEAGKSDNMGKKRFIPYGLYRMEGYVSASLANKVTKFSEEDLELLWEAIINMFEHDHAASKGKMATRKLYVFKHDSELGNYPSHKLFELIEIEKKDDINYPRNFKDYNITVNEKEIPEQVSLIVKL